MFDLNSNGLNLLAIMVLNNYFTNMYNKNNDCK